MADVEPGLPARRNCVATGKVMVKCERFDRWMVFPGGKMPPSTAGKDACRHIFRQALRRWTENGGQKRIEYDYSKRQRT